MSSCGLVEPAHQVQCSVNCPLLELQTEKSLSLKTRCLNLYTSATDTYEPGLELSEICDYHNSSSWPSSDACAEDSQPNKTSSYGLDDSGDNQQKIGDQINHADIFLWNVKKSLFEDAVHKTSTCVAFSVNLRFQRTRKRHYCLVSKAWALWWLRLTLALWNADFRRTSEVLSMFFLKCSLCLYIRVYS